jgi:aspartyl-tRNA(Asn)/glutamyl-tRNA(Gln) amidotransferase subunit A
MGSFGGMGSFAGTGGVGGTGVIDTLRMTAEGAHDLLRRKEVSGEELFAAYRAAIDERDPELRCFLRLCEDSGGDGLPIALKDVIGTKGVETTAGSRILAGYVPVYDSTVAGRCKEHGLRLLGKTNTDEFAMGSSTENSAFGPSRNPWDPSRVPGGSGGGSAAAVSAGLAPWALGSDTGGSIKQPSALCGNVGLRPTYGTVSRYGIVAFASSLDQVGPVAKTVRDNAFLYSVISGRDPADSTTVDVPTVELPVAEDLKGLRVGVPVEMRDAAGIESGVRDTVARAVELCAELGATVEECSLPRSVEYGLPCYYLIAPAEASSNLARYDGVRYGHRARAAAPPGEPGGRAAEGIGGDGLIEVYERTRSEGFGDEPKRRIMLGAYALSAGYYEAYYGKAQQVRTVIIREHAAVFERFDVIVSATSPTVAFPIGARADDPLAMYASDLLTIPSCMAGLPGLSIPCGLSEGLPVGLQLIGPQLSENTLFRAGHALERALGFDYVPERLR